MESLDFNKRLSDLKLKCDKYNSGITSQLTSASEIRSEFEARNKQFRDKLDQHYIELIDKIILGKKHMVEVQVESIYSQMDERVTEAMNEAFELKTRLNDLLDKYQALVTDPYYTPQPHQYTNADNEADEDALMINESVNEFDLNNNESKPNNSEMMQLERAIEAILNQRVQLAEITHEILSRQDAYYNDLIRLNPCDVPDLDGVCLGHIQAGVGLEENVSNSFPAIDLLDHTKFRFETDLSAKFLYCLNEKIKIDFSCPNYSTPDGQVAYTKSFHENMIIRATDPSKNPVYVGISEKIEHKKHTVRLTMEIRETPGIYEVLVQYKHCHIPGSPFHIAIAPKNETSSPSSNQLSKTSLVSNEPVLELNASGRSSVSSMHNQTDPSPTYQTTTPRVSSRDPNLAAQTGVVSAGRGRVINKLRMKSLGEPGAPKSGIQLTTFPSQKRPMSIGDSDAHPHAATVDAEDLDGELSSKLQKLVTVDERSQEITFKDDEMASDAPVCVASAHLRKYLQQPNRPLKTQIPSLRAEFVKKYSVDFKFPIGVRFCAFRDWLIVCDCGNDAIKILNGSTGALVAQIAGKGKDSYTLKRPSAVLIDNENQSDIYVKDDKEILVFDMNNNFKFVKKFGHGILRKPYGLAYDRNYNLVVVDADFRDPRVHVFNKETGKLVKSNKYEPVLGQFSNSSTLSELFAHTGRLCNGVAALEKSKIRFIDCYNDTLYASDLGRSVIFKTSVDGEIELAFGHFGKRVGELNEPSGIHAERDGGAILVGDSKNDRIQIYGTDGLYKCDVDIKEKVVRPSDLYVDDFGYMYVSCFIQHCIKKYKLVSP